MPAGYVNDAQPAHAQEHVGVGIPAFVVRPAMGEEGEERWGNRDWSLAGTNEAEDAAHNRAVSGV